MKKQTKQQIQREKLKQYYKAWVKKNPEKVKAIKQRYEIKRKAERKRIRDKKKQEMYF